jgi:ABC-type transport system involved in Fe-S cluster assembly fused permease/ATPase subunit
MSLQVILLSSIFTNHLTVSLSYSEDKEVLNGVSNVAKLSETAVVESASEEKLVTINLLLLYRLNKTLYSTRGKLNHSLVCHSTLGFASCVNSTHA